MTDCFCGRKSQVANRFGVPTCWDHFFAFPLPKVTRARIVRYERPNYGITSGLEQAFKRGGDTAVNQGGKHVT